MADRWTDTPPAPCHITGRDQPKPGQPYLVEDFHYAVVKAGPDGGPRVLPRVLPLVHAASQLRRVCELPGSPFKLLTDAEVAVYENAVAERDELALRVQELEAELGETRGLEQVVDNALKNGLIERLDERYARKTGRKPSPRAA